MNAEEQTLVSNIRLGSRPAFERLLDLYERKVYNLAFRMLGRREDAEDAAQEALLEVYRGIGGFRGRSSLGTWIHAVARNVCLEFLRKRRETVPLEAELVPANPASNPGSSAERGELRGRLEAAIGELPDPQREVVVMHEMHGMKYREIAEAVGCPVGTVKSRLFHAMENLRAMLADYVVEGAQDEM